jgi:hypothetical protein
VDDLTVEGPDPDRPSHFKEENAAWQFSRYSMLSVRHIGFPGLKRNGINVDDSGECEEPVECDSFGVKSFFT